MTSSRSSLLPVVLLSLALWGCAQSTEVASNNTTQTPISTPPLKNSPPISPTTPPIATTDTTPSPTNTAVTTTTTVEASTPAAPDASAPFASDTEAEFAGILDATLDQLPNPAASVIATVRTTDGRAWNGAAGGTDTAEQPVRIASVGKTFTAATVFRLIEDGRLDLDDPIAGRLLPATVDLLEPDGYDTSSITIRHLLQHTAGLFDYSFGEGSPLLDRALNDQSHRWTRREQLELAVSVGDPVSSPGEAFHYGDTGYVLLGEIIEQATGMPYHEAMRVLLGFERLGLDTTWMESEEPAPPGAGTVARSFFDQADLTPLDFSIDAFGGGGLAASTLDVARFYEALLAGRVFAKPETLTAMTEVPETTNLNLTDFGVTLGDGASGLYRMNLGDVGECWSHRGFLGTIAVTCPASGVTAVVTTNTALTEPLPIAVDLLKVSLQR